MRVTEDDDVDATYATIDEQWQERLLAKVRIFAAASAIDEDVLRAGAKKDRIALTDIEESRSRIRNRA